MSRVPRGKSLLLRVILELARVRKTIAEISLTAVKVALPSLRPGLFKFP